MAPVLFGHVRPSLLARVEKALDAGSTEPWSHRRLPTPSATLPAVVDSEDEEYGSGGNAYARGSTRELSTFTASSDKRVSEGFLQQTTESGEVILKQVRAVRKKLQQIEALELKQAKGQVLDDQQLLKLQTKRELERVLASLESGVLPEAKREAKHGKESVDKSTPIEENQKGGSSSSKQRRRLERKKSKGHGVTEPSQTGQMDVHLPVRIGVCSS